VAASRLCLGIHWDGKCRLLLLSGTAASKWSNPTMQLTPSRTAFTFYYD